MIVCNLTKPENTLDQVKKHLPNVVHTDAAQLAVALVLSAKYAVAVYDDNSYRYPQDVPKLTEALSKEIALIQTSVENTKKAKAAAAEEEPVEVKVGLTCNLQEGEQVLADREDLKTLLSDLIQEGVEFQFSNTDVLWQWALDRANWSTISGGELTRRVKLKTEFQDNSVGTDLSIGTGKRRGSRQKAATAAAAAAMSEKSEAANEAPAEDSANEAVPED